MVNAIPSSILSNRFHFKLCISLSSLTPFVIFLSQKSFLKSNIETSFVILHAISRLILNTARSRFISFYYCHIIFLLLFSKVFLHRHPVPSIFISLNAFCHFQRDKLAFSIYCKRLNNTLRCTHKPIF